MQYPTSPCSIDESFVSYSERLPSLHIPTSPSLLRRQGTTAAHKKRYMHNWENIFGRHTSKYSARGLWDLIKKEGKIVLFLVLLGATGNVIHVFNLAFVLAANNFNHVVSVLDYGINESIVGLRWTQAKLFTYLESQQPTSPDEVWNYSLGGAIAWGLVFALISISWTHYVDPFAGTLEFHVNEADVAVAGSGIPEIKTILSADQRHAPGRYLRSRTLFAKSIGLATAQASGLSVGKEGPFVHTACIICHQLMKHCAFFHRIYRNESLHRHMYNAACAVGVASTFGAPIGGVLFSIEVTSSFLLLSNYWKSFVAAVSGSVMKQVLDYITTQSQQRLHSFQALFPTSYSDKSFGQLELFAFGLLGVLMGVLGATYVSMATRLRRFFAPLNRRFPLLWGGFISVVVTVVVFTPGPFNHLGVSDTLKDLCSPTPLGPNWQWQGSVLGPLAVSAVSKIFITLLSVSLPIPSGDFIPLFTAGAACGRLVGELILFIFPTVDIVPGGYALVGGAALVASSTHTISVADVMEDQLTCLPNRTTKGEIRALLKRFSRSSVPVVVDRSSRLFCGCVAREDLHALLTEDDHDGASNLQTTTTGGVYMRQAEAGSTSTMVVDAVDDDHVVVLSDVVEMSGNVLKVDEDTPLETVHLLFEMLKCAKLFVTKFGVLEGVVTRASMHNRLTYLAPPDPSALLQQPVERHDDMVC
ncbi:hypothetical protein DYB37_005479 [Aphanomyces astaci]|uniref:CBS domain-containing protein n=1 Tax=Aphanomyces astaci TaxID=112090 RepID=A0A397AFN9_APHAT|nr:hypothetical protein DYB36_003507 [Aphanomyces astaci]RHY13588.1 hypothetical protein DYB25_002800 [Aphanomyces astaci]RHY94356.1 hypothetical protein DYB35_004921 [Aphanomyces astaci]RHZ24065.1 hypothetical protein DYB37_005479 [Aphanomyces astaci]RLO00757.1 hypothetical protein DYB28_002785 [Aphanomyces astaci]